MSQASGKVALVEKKYIKTDLPAFSSGDTVRVHVRIKEGDKERVQIFEGAVIAFNNTGSRRSFTVRKISHGVGVERVFPLFSPKLAKIEVAEKGRVRRAKIYYVRGLSGKAARIRSESETQ
ncbi:MAG: 50S ribosomal protein L19 [Bdellovibrionota bacterium]